MQKKEIAPMNAEINQKEEASHNLRMSAYAEKMGIVLEPLSKKNEKTEGGNC